MLKQTKNKSYWIFILLMSLSLEAMAQDNTPQTCFLKEGDNWGFYGDSITDFNVYPRVIERILRHFHPEAKITFFNNAVGGKKAEEGKAEDVLKDNPTLVTIMFGMNDAGVKEWEQGKPVQPLLDKYYANMKRILRGIKEKGVTVVIMSPTLCDEKSVMFNLAGRPAIIREMGRICEDLANELGVYFVDAQKAFEDAQENQTPPYQPMRYDGVHPSSTGAYRLARMFWEEFNFQAPLSKSQRELSGSDYKRLDLKLEVSDNVLPQSKEQITFSLTSPKPVACKIVASYNGGRLEENLQINDQPLTWAPKLPASAFPRLDGKVEDIVISAEANGETAIFFVDITRNKVIHMKDNVAKTSIPFDVKNAASSNIAEITFKRDNNAFNFEATIQDDYIFHNPSANGWPWNGDNITVFLDMRPGKRYGGIGFDSDVFQFWYQPRNTPVFTPGFRSWYGAFLENFSTPYGFKSDSSYTVGLTMDGWINLHNIFDVSKLDYIGFDMAVTDRDENNKKSGYYRYMNTELQTFLYPNCFAIIDLNGKLNTDSAYTVSVYK